MDIFIVGALITLVALKLFELVQREHRGRDRAIAQHRQLELLEQIAAAHRPAAKLPLAETEAITARIVSEAVALAEQTQKVNNANGKSFKGRDKFNVARDYAKKRLGELHIELDPTMLAHRLEAAAREASREAHR